MRVEQLLPKREWRCFDVVIALWLLTASLWPGQMAIAADVVTQTMQSHLNRLCSSGVGGTPPPSVANLCSDFSAVAPNELAMMLRQLAPLEATGQMQWGTRHASRQVDYVKLRMSNLSLSISGNLGASDSRTALYAGAYLGEGSHDASVYEDAYQSRSRGFTASADYRITDKFIAGAVFGSQRANISVADDGGRFDSKGYRLLAYSSYYVSNKAYLEAVWSVHKNLISATRNINYRVAASPKSAVASYEADNGVVSVGLGTGYEAYNKHGLRLNLSANVDVFQSSFDGYRELGADDKALLVNKRDVNTPVYTLNGQLDYALRFSYGVLIPVLDLSWIHEFEDQAPTVTASFRDDPQHTTFTLSGDTPDNDYFMLQMGASYIIGGGTGGYLFYNTSLGRSGYSQYTFNLGISIPV